MPVTAKIYEGVVGLIIDCALYDRTGTVVDYAGITTCELRVLRPGETDEEIWTATVEDPNIIRHVVPADAELTAGKYKIQPYIETTDGFKGLWGTVELIVTRKWK